MSFMVGEKVICIDNTTGAVSTCRLLELNKVYVVERPESDNHGLYLEGIPAGFYSWRFKRLLELDYVSPDE